MCSIGDDNLEDLGASQYMPIEESPPPFSKCNKCKVAEPIVLLRAKDRYCKECFQAGTVHKFKALLGKHKLIRPNDRVLVVHRCGHPSTALLHFIRTGIDLTTHKKLRFEPVVVFVEDYVSLPFNERRELLKKVENEIARFNFPAYFTTRDLLVKKGAVDSTVKSKAEDVQLEDEDKRNTQKNATNLNDSLRLTLQSCLMNVARFLDCKFIFTPEISSDVASQLLTDVALGRGSQIALNSGFCDSRDENVKILRPLRLFDMKEIAFYNHLNGLEPVMPTPTADNPHDSVQGLMKKFVTDLQVNYPATVTTILKTGDKLAVNATKGGKCQLCGAPISEESNSELTSAESTQFSHWVSTQVHDEGLNTQERYSKTLEEFNKLTCSTYCFSCRKLMIE